MSELVADIGPSDPGPKSHTSRFSPPTFEGALSRLAFASPIGELQLVASHVGVRALLFENDSLGPFIRSRVMNIPNQENKHLTQAAKELGEYFQGKRVNFSTALEPRGTMFQLQVWQQLTLIPYGTVWSYSDFAAFLKRPKSQRAVGAANRANPLGIFLPCHRVCAKNGALRGFAGGLDLKAYLIALEARNFDLNENSSEKKRFSWRQTVD